jgi:hypothetical protein
MATQIAFSRCANFGTGHVPVLVADENLISETISETASSQATTIAAPVAVGERVLAYVVAKDAAVYVSFGAAPNASLDAGRILIAQGGTIGVSVKGGHKAAVVTA